MGDGDLRGCLRSDCGGNGGLALGGCVIHVTRIVISLVFGGLAFSCFWTGISLPTSDNAENLFMARAAVLALLAIAVKP